jgi:hypothetical protein
LLLRPSKLDRIKQIETAKSKAKNAEEKRRKGERRGIEGRRKQDGKMR